MSKALKKSNTNTNKDEIHNIDKILSKGIKRYYKVLEKLSEN